MYTLLLALIYLAFISLGLPDSLLGAGWPMMHLSVNVPISYLGILSMTISGGTIVSSLLSDTLTRRFGTQTVTVISVFLTAVAMLGFSVSQKFWMLLLFAVPYGFGAGSIDAALNNYVALHYTSRHMSWLHCFWGVGTIVSPFVMSWALTNSVWNTGYRTVSFIQFGIALILLLTLPVWKAVRTEEDAETAKKSPGIAGALKIKGVLPLFAGFFAYCAAEATAMGWASTYMVEVKHASVELAARFGSLFFIGMTVGRFFGGFIMNKLGDRKMIRIGFCVLTVGVLLLVLSGESTALAAAGLVVFGLGCAPIYPCTIHSTPVNFGAENSGPIISIQMACAYFGTTFMPPLFGLLGSFTGYGIFPLYMFLFNILMLVMLERMFRVRASA